MVNGEHQQYADCEQALVNAAGKYVVKSISARADTLVIELTDHSVVQNDLNADWVKDQEKETGEAISFSDTSVKGTEKRNRDMYVRRKDIKPFDKKVWLASPTMHGDELKYITEAYDSNWMSTVGANINEVEHIAA